MSTSTVSLSSFSVLPGANMLEDENDPLPLSIGSMERTRSGGASVRPFVTGPQPFELSFGSSVSASVRPTSRRLSFKGSPPRTLPVVSVPSARRISREFAPRVNDPRTLRNTAVLSGLRMAPSGALPGGSIDSRPARRVRHRLDVLNSSRSAVPVEV